MGFADERMGRPMHTMQHDLLPMRSAAPELQATLHSPLNDQALHELVYERIVDRIAYLVKPTGSLPQLEYVPIYEINSTHDQCQIRVVDVISEPQYK